SRRPHEHAGDRTRHSPGRSIASLDTRSAGTALARADRSRLARAVRRSGGGANDLVGAGSKPQPRYLARDPQYRWLWRRDWRRSLDADPRAWRHHADPADGGEGLAHADAPRLRSRGAAARLLDPLHRDRGRLCQLLAAWRRLATADRTRRGCRRRAGAGARGGGRPAGPRLSPCAREPPVRRPGADLPA